MRKRIVAVLLAASLSISGLLAGCGNDNSKDKETTKKTEASADSSDAKDKEEKSKEDKKKEKLIKPEEKKNNSQSENENSSITDTEDENSSDSTEENTSGDEDQDSSETTDQNTSENTDDNSSDDDQDSNPDENNSGETQTLSGTVQEVNGNAIAVKVENDGIYVFDRDALSGMDDSIQAGDSVVINYNGDVTNPDSADISHQ